MTLVKFFDGHKNLAEEALKQVVASEKLKKKEKVLRYGDQKLTNTMSIVF